MPVKLNFKMYQGSTFNQVLRWESPDIAFKNITAITKTAPAVLTSVAHGIPKGWRVLVTDVVGMKEINSVSTYVDVTDTAADTLTLGTVNAASYTTYTSGGVITYNTPVDLTGYTARMQVRATLAATDTLFDLTTENGGIALDATLCTITLNISATDTALADFKTSVYSLEMAKTGVITQLVTGNISFTTEVTR